MNCTTRPILTNFAPKHSSYPQAEHTIRQFETFRRWQKKNPVHGWIGGVNKARGSEPPFTTPEPSNWELADSGSPPPARTLDFGPQRVLIRES